MTPAPPVPEAYRLPEATHAETLELFRRLLRVDTTNPPGNEAEAASLLAAWLRERGLEPQLFESAPGRSNLVCRLEGSGEAGGPLLLNGHLDVVPADPEHWTHPPFEAEIADGFVWGRGAIDMKNMVAMAAACMARLKATGETLKRTLIFAAVADEEAGCALGSRWLVEEHPESVRAEIALGELGGFPLWLGPRPVMPIQVAEKGIAWLRMTARGRPGHGSVPRSDTAVVKLAHAIARLGTTRLPQHLTPTVERFVRAVAAELPMPGKLVLPGLFKKRLSGLIIDHLLPDPELADVFAALLSNTASPTVLRAGTKTNVIPGEASVELDGRTLPGHSAGDLIAELRALVGEDVEFSVEQEQPASVFPADTELMGTIREVLTDLCPSVQTVPNMIPGFTDAKSWASLGTIAYGFTPVWFPEDAGVAFSNLYHGHDERIPVDGFRWGSEVLYETVRRLCGLPKPVS